MAQGVVIVEVFVAQGQAEDPLGQQVVDRVLDQIRIAVVVEAGGQSSEDAGLGLDLPQEEAAGVRSDGPAVKSRGDATASQPLEIEPACVTLCQHWAASLLVALFV